MHKYNRNFEIKVNKHCDSDHDRAVLRIIVKWLYSIPKKMESMEQVKHSQKVMFQWMQTTGCSRSLIKETEIFWDNKANTGIREMAHFNYMNVYGGWICTTSFQESENSALARDSMGPKANQSIDSSQAAIQAHEDRLVEKLTQNHYEAKKKITMSYVDSVFLELSRTITQAIVQKAKIQYDKRIDYSHYQLSECQFYVKKHIWEELDYIEPDDGNYYQKIVPSYQMTRVVSILCGIMECSCGHFAMTRIPCRHIMSILSVPPSPADFWFKHFKCFSTFYGIHKTFTAYCDNLDEPEGPIMTSMKSFDTTRSKKNLDWFKETLISNTPKLRHGLVHEEDITFDYLEDIDNDCDNQVNSPVGMGQLTTLSQLAVPLINKTVDMNAPYKDSAFQNLKPTFELMTKNIKTKNDYKIVKEAMTTALKQVLRNNLITPKKDNENSTMVAMPILETKKKVARKMPAGDPRRFGKKKKH